MAAPGGQRGKNALVGWSCEQINGTTGASSYSKAACRKALCSMTADFFSFNSEHMLIALTTVTA